MRVGGVHALFEPRVDPTPGGFLLTLVAWGGPEVREEVARGTIIVAEATPTALADGFASLASRALDNSRFASLVPTRAFPRVTTRSLAALRTFAEADGLMRRSLSAAAVPLLHEAIRADSQFASAYAHLAWALENRRRPMSEVRPYLDRAMELRETVSERERWFIAGSFFQLTDRPGDAVAAYQRALTADPDHHWSLGNLSRIKNERGDHDAAAQLLLRRAYASPDSLVSQYLAAGVTAALGQKDAARHFRARTAALLGNVSPAEAGIPETWLPLASACDAWERGDVVAAAGIADTLRLRIASAPDSSLALGFLYLDLGMTRRAEEMFEASLSAPHDRSRQAGRLQFLAMAAAARGDWPLARSRLIEFSRTFVHAMPSTGPLLVEAGLVAEADRLSALWDRERYWPEHVLAPFRAAILGAHGRVDEARRRLDAALPQLARPDLSWVGGMETSGQPFLTALRLDAKWKRDVSRLADAIATLEQADIDRFPICTANRWTGSTWMTLRQELATAYRQQGSAEKATAVEADLRRRLALADPDHAVLRALGAASRQ